MELGSGRDRWFEAVGLAKDVEEDWAFEILKRYLEEPSGWIITSLDNNGTSRIAELVLFGVHVKNKCYASSHAPKLAVIMLIGCQPFFNPHIA